MTNRLLFLWGVFLISSCSLHRGSLGDINTQTLEEETWVDIALSRGKTVNFLGIGGNSKTALLSDLKTKFYSNTKTLCIIL